VAPSDERCADLQAPRGAALCHTRLRVWQKSLGRGGKSPALLVSSILNATQYHFVTRILRVLKPVPPGPYAVSIAV